ncbi:MAG: nicotinamidase [Planctomycetaceae bacterium]|nr:nicotinamidase [Planctomycetaceae bacterium]
MHKPIFVLALALTTSGLLIFSSHAAEEHLELHLRRQVETEPAAGRFHSVLKVQHWHATETAVIVCDMWDLHHCLNATRRGAEMAPRMDAVLKTVRDRGGTIIHAPSGCMDFYREHAARQRALQVPHALNMPPEIGEWCDRIDSEENGTYPIDQSDGGDDDDPLEHREWAAELKRMERNPNSPWVRQTESLVIDGSRDFVSDDGEEIWSILEQRKIENVVLVGVHTNMCVLGRPFGLRQLSKNGKNVVLMRDMTDTMYNPARAPQVSHFTGTDLIVEHIEKWVCPTITSNQLLGGDAFRFQDDERPRLTILMAEREYGTNRSLPAFARQHLGSRFQVRYVFANPQQRNDLPGVAEALQDADVLLVSVRRRALPKRQMEAIRQFVACGKPVVGIRTANHAFSLRGETPPAGKHAWETFDQDVLAGNYTGHHGESSVVTVNSAEGAHSHPVLAGVDLRELAGHGSLYKVSPLRATALPLLVGSIPREKSEPVAWVNENPAGGRVFYTSLGHQRDFHQPAMNRLLVNALLWAADLAPR